MDERGGREGAVALDRIGLRRVIECITVSVPGTGSTLSTHLLRYMVVESITISISI